MANRWVNSGDSERLYFLGLQNHCRWCLQPWNQEMLPPWKKSYDKTRQHTKKQRHYFADKWPSSQSYGFSSSHVWMWELDYKESWVPKNWCFWTVVLEKTLESPLDYKEIKPVRSKGNQPWIFTGRTDAKIEAPILWPPDVKSCLAGKDCDAGKKLKTGGEGDDRGQNDWMASLTQWAWVWASSRDGEAQGSLVFCNPWGRKESDMTEELNNNKGLFCVWTIWISQAGDGRTYILVQLSSVEFCIEIWSQRSR